MVSSHPPSSEFHPEIPNAARIYDCLLGGKNHFTADRQAASAILETIPDVAVACRDNRQFLARVVRYLVAETGIRQIIDIGTGLPTQENVHEVAAKENPAVQVIYVDNDPTVVAHARALLEKGNDNVWVVRADLNHPSEILHSPVIRGVLDFNQPIAVLAIAILHFIMDAAYGDTSHAHTVIRTIMDAMPSGSYLALSHATDDFIGEDQGKYARGIYDSASSRLTPRSLHSVSRFFDGLTLIPPGVVDINAWRPEHEMPNRGLVYGGMALKN